MGRSGSEWVAGGRSEPEWVGVGRGGSGVGRSGSE